MSQNIFHILAIGNVGTPKANCENPTRERRVLKSYGLSRTAKSLQCQHRSDLQDITDIRQIFPHKSCSTQILKIIDQGLILTPLFQKS